MTSDELTIVVEYLAGTWGLNLPRVDNLITIQEQPGGSVLTGWNINHVQPTQTELQTTFDSPQFTSYLSNRIVIIERNAAKLRLDKEQKFLIKVLVKQFNAIRTQIGMPNITLAQVKNAFDNET